MTPPIAAASDWIGSYQRNERVFSIQWEITERCNFSCAHCYLTQSSRVGAGAANDASFAEATALLDAFVEVGALFVTFTGGEVFLYPRFLELCAEARRRGLGVRILSNGSLIGEAEAEDLAALGVLSVELTLYASTPDGYRRVTGEPCGFDGIAGAILALQHHGVPVALKIFYMKANADEAEAIERLVQRMAAPVRRYFSLLPRFDEGLVPLQVGISREQASRIAELVQDPRWIDRYDESRESRLCGRCGRGRLFVTARGDVTPCSSIRHVVLGNTRTQSLVDIWRGAEGRLRTLNLRGGTKPWEVLQGVSQ